MTDAKFPHGKKQLAASLGKVADIVAVYFPEAVQETGAGGVCAFLVGDQVVAKAWKDRATERWWFQFIPQDSGGRNSC